MSVKKKNLIYLYFVEQGKKEGNRHFIHTSYPHYIFKKRCVYLPRRLLVYDQTTHTTVGTAVSPLILFLSTAPGEAPGEHCLFIRLLVRYGLTWQCWINAWT